MAGRITAVRQQQQAAAAAGAAEPQMLGQAPVSKGPEGQAAGLHGDGGAGMLPGLHVHLDGSASSIKSDPAALPVHPLVHSPDAGAAGGVAAGGAACCWQPAGVTLRSSNAAGATSGQQASDAASSGAASAADPAPFGGATCGQQSVVGSSMGAGSAAEPAASLVAGSRPGAGLAGWGSVAGRPADAESHPDTGDVIIDMAPDGSTGRQPPQGEAWGQEQSPSAAELSVRGCETMLPWTLLPGIAGTTVQAQPSTQSLELPARPADTQADRREPLLPEEGNKEPAAGSQDPEVCCCSAVSTCCLHGATSGFQGLWAASISAAKLRAGKICTEHSCNKSPCLT